MGLYTVMFYGGLVLAIIFLIVSGILFFVLDIPKAVGVVTGKTQRKAIEEIRAGGKPTTEKSRRGRGRGGNIIARDVKVSEAKKKETEQFKLEEANKKLNEQKRSSDASDNLAKKAAEDARAAVEKSKAKAMQALEEESTEVLTYQDMKNKDDSEDTTKVLEMEQATDILSAGDELYDVEPESNGDDDETVILASEVNSVDIDDDYDDEETDVLRSTSASSSEDEEVTDVLRTTAKPYSGDDDSDDDYEDEADKTDVLTSESTLLSEDEIYGTYNPEMTAVLRSDMAPGEHSVEKKVVGLDRPEITVIYCETVVHTEESL
ncbi:MAG: hypothetical protein K6F60_00215 [Eubacterium sp.]|nr:hypothetical protein [Eubacterium sp.]